MYKVDPNNNKKQVPKQLVRHNPSFIQTFATNADAQVANPVKGSMTYSTASDKIYIYNGADWKTFTRD